MKKIAILTLSLFLLACNKEIDSTKMYLNNSSNSNAIAMSANSNGIAFSVENKNKIDVSLDNKSNKETKSTGLSLIKGGVNVQSSNSVKTSSGKTNINIGISSNTIVDSNGGLDFNSSEAEACSKDSEEIWKSTTEYHNFYDNPDIIKPYHYGYFAQAKLIQIILDNCGEFLSDKDKESFKKLRDDALKVGNDLINNAGVSIEVKP
jgi:hypothetical protein